MAKKDGFDFLDAASAAHRREEVTVPGVDRTVYVQAISVAEMRALTEAYLRPGKSESDEDPYDNEALGLAIVARCVVDGQGRRLIPAGREQEIYGLPKDTFLLLQEAALRLNGLEADAGN